jgi:hypothetical protein
MGNTEHRAHECNDDDECRKQRSNRVENCSVQQGRATFEVNQIIFQLPFRFRVGNIVYQLQSVYGAIYPGNKN